MLGLARPTGLLYSLSKKTRIFNFDKLSVGATKY